MTQIETLRAFGNIRVYGDDIDSFIYKAIKDNANRFADYAKKLKGKCNYDCH